MNINTQQLFRRLFEVFKETLKDAQNDQVHQLFKDYFTRSELIEILTFIYGENAEKHLQIVRLNNEQLLEHLSTLNILEYSLNAWEKEQSKNIALTPIAVWNTLEQLGLQTHYLGQKSLSEWDEYDHNNYKNLQRKSGKIQKVFGLYDVDVKQDDITSVSKQPLRFYDSKQQAENAKNELCKQGKYSSDEIHILELHKSV